MRTPRIPPLQTFGFTLLELMIAIGIVAILSILAFNGSQQLSTAKKRIGCISHLRQLHQIFQLYAADHTNCLPIGYTKTAPKTWTSQIEDYLPYRYATHKLDGITYCPETTKVKAENEPDIRKKRNRSGWFTDYNINEHVAANGVPNPNSLATISGNLILLFDGGGSVVGSAGNNDGKATKRHSDRFNVIFVDGHAENLSTFEEHNQHWKKQ